MSDEEEKNIILLARVEQEKHTPNSVRFTADCGHECWIGAETLRMHYAPTPITETKCLECSEMNLYEMLKLAAQGRVREIPGARESLAREVGEEETDHMYRLLGLGPRAQVPRVSHEDPEH